MSWITNILTGTVGSVIGKIGGVVDNLHLSGEEKQQFKLDMATLLQQRDSELEQTLRAELQTKERILVAELQQSDKFTKRARPAVVYIGLLAIVYNYCLIPTLQMFTGTEILPFNLPPQFWAAWGGIVATWSIGRTMEKRGSGNKVTKAITGSNSFVQPPKGTLFCE